LTHAGLCSDIWEGLANMSELEKTGGTAGVSRRTVAKAMAWSVPAIAVAVAVPLASASAPPIVFNPNSTSTVCKATGAGKCCAPDSYRFVLTFKNDGTVDYTVAIATNAASASPNGCNTVTGPLTGTSVTLAPGETGTLAFCTQPTTGCNATGAMDISFTYTYTGEGGQPVSVPATAHWGGMSPCDPKHCG
jgi:hypothetical protein